MAKRKDPLLDAAVWTCQRKKGYESERRALQIAAHTTTLGGPTLYPYRCAECKRWHLSKMPSDIAAAKQAWRAQKADRGR